MAEDGRKPAAGHVAEESKTNRSSVVAVFADHCGLESIYASQSSEEADDAFYQRPLECVARVEISAQLLSKHLLSARVLVL